MGVEYAHYLLAADPNWIGDIDAARRVHDVLSRWQLVATPPELFELQGGRTKKLRGQLATLKNPPANLLVRYPFVSGVPTIEEIVGPSYYEASAIGPRYFQRIGVVVGTDFRIGPIAEQFYIEVLRPPLQDGQEVQEYKHSDLISGEFFGSYPADTSTVPPLTQLEPPDRFPEGFLGVWRAGIMLDCGKDLPRIDGLQPLRVNPRFSDEIETAFDTRLVQIGKIY